MIGIAHLRMITEQPTNFPRCVALKTKSLARNHKTGRGCSGSPSAPPSTALAAKSALAARTMDLDDVLLWLSVFSLVAGRGMAIWVLLPL